jgi:nitric oxide reductase NorD protein
MRIPHFWEPEETIGELWHRFIDPIDALPHYPDAAVSFDEEKGALGVFFRGLGGDFGVDLRAAKPAVSGHRLSFLRRLGHESERLDRASFDGLSLDLPPRIDLFPSRDLNRALYRWLAAWSAFAPEPGQRFADPLRSDLMALREAVEGARATLAACPGLAADHAALKRACLELRPKRRLPPVEAALEAAIVALMSDQPAEGEAQRLLAAILQPEAALGGFTAPLDYKPFAPAPIWPLRLPLPPGSGRKPSDEDRDAGSGAADGSDKRFKGERRKSDQADRKDSLIIHRFETIMSWVEFMNLNRSVEDEDESRAKKALDDLDKVTLAQHHKKAATKLAFDIDLAPEDMDGERLAGTSLKPEWDWKRQRLVPGHCRVLASLADEAAGPMALDAAARRRVRDVRRRFEALRPRRATFNRQIDGAELDLDAVVRSRVDVLATGEGSNRIYKQSRNAERELAVALLVDTSRSSESACADRRVIDVSKEATLAFVDGVTACGDAVAAYAFSSLRRDRVYVRTCKRFDEPVNAAVHARIASLKPGFYTRIGAALRHVTGEIAARGEKKRLIVVLTDGKPNDLDHYEGRYGVEDTRHAVSEARKQGIAVFGVTVDAKGRDYFPYIFGANGYAIVSHPERLTQALPLLWAHLVS